MKKLSLILLYSILLTCQPNNITSKLKQIEDFSEVMKMLNPIYAQGNLYKGIYTLIDSKVYSSVIMQNPILVFDYLGIKWNVEKTMILQACGDYLTFYQKHYRWQNFFKQLNHLQELFERKKGKQEEKLSHIADSNSIFLQGIVLENQEAFYYDIDFLNFCSQLLDKNSALLQEPEFIKVIINVLQVNSKPYHQNSTEAIIIKKTSDKILKKIL